MRLIVLAATASLCLLAGCNKGAANNSTNAPAANTAEPAPAPEANAAAPAASSANRDNEVRECVTDLSRRAAPGSDVGALCGCAVDRVAAGAQQNDAVTQCAAELHVTLSAGDGPPEAPAGNTAE